MRGSNLRWGGNGRQRLEVTASRQRGITARQIVLFCVHFPNDPPPGFWHPAPWPLLRGLALSVYRRGRRLSVYKRGSRARGKKADKLLNEEANYPGHHTSSCQQATFGQSGSETSRLCGHLAWPTRPPRRYPLAHGHQLAGLFPHKRPAS